MPLKYLEPMQHLFLLLQRTFKTSKTLETSICNIGDEARANLFWPRGGSRRQATTRKHHQLDAREREQPDQQRWRVRQAGERSEQCRLGACNDRTNRGGCVPERTGQVARPRSKQPDQ
jgi:hypothetical protein